MLKPSLAFKLNEKIVYECLIMGAIFIDYPLKREGWLNGIVFNNFYYYLDHKNNLQVDSTKSDYTDERELSKRFWNRKGVAVDNNCVLCDVSPLNTIVRNSDGKLQKLYNDRRGYYVPIELTSLNTINNQIHFIQMLKDFDDFSLKFKKIDHEFTKGKECLLLTKTNFGQLGIVDNFINNKDKGYGEYNEINYTKYYDSNINYDLQSKDWQVDLNELYNGPLVQVKSSNQHQTSLITEHNFAKHILKKSEEYYLSSAEVANELNTSEWCLSLLTSSLYVVNCNTMDDVGDDARLSDLEYWNIGLNLKSKARENILILPGYSRFSYNYDNPEQENGYWEFSTKGVNLLKEYKEKFSFVFESLDKFRNLYNRQNKFFKVKFIINILDF